jgi:hypothetical protein
VLGDRASDALPLQAGDCTKWALPAGQPPAGTPRLSRREP